jgi:hypothetical protein
MKCSRCNSESVIKLTNNNVFLCRRHFLRYFDAKVIRTIRNGKLIEKGDKVACEIYSTLAPLRSLEQYVKWKVITLSAVLPEKISRKEEKKFREYCTKRGIPLLSRKSYASAKKKFTKIVLEQDMDDVCAGILENFSASKSIFKKDALSDGKVIKPFYFLSKKEVALYSSLAGLSLPTSPQKISRFSSALHKMLDNMEEKYSGTRFGIINSFQEMLPMLKEKKR